MNHFKQVAVAVIMVGAVSGVPGCSQSLRRVVQREYGKSFEHTLKNDKPYTGKVVYVAAGDYYWVTEYDQGKFVVQENYLIDLKTNEHRLIFVRRSLSDPAHSFDPIKSQNK